jgi:hypothetical protein
MALSEQQVNDENIDEFAELWKQYDHDGDMFIEAHHLPKLLLQLGYPLGCRDMPGVYHAEQAAESAARMTMAHTSQKREAAVEERKRAKDLKRSLEIPFHDGMINFNETLNALTEMAIGNADTIGMDKFSQAKVLNQIGSKLDQKKKVTTKRRNSRVIQDLNGEGEFTLKDHSAAEAIQAQFRGKAARKSVAEIKKKKMTDP